MNRWTCLSHEAALAVASGGLTMRWWMITREYTTEITTHNSKHYCQHRYKAKWHVTPLQSDTFRTVGTESTRTPGLYKILLQQSLKVYQRSTLQDLRSVSYFDFNEILVDSWVANPTVNKWVKYITTCDKSRDWSRCISARSSHMRRATGSSLTTGLFTMFLARWAYSSVLIVSV